MDKTQSADRKYNKIGGWLILIVIVLFLHLIILSKHVYTDLSVLPKLLSLPHDSTDRLQWLPPVIVEAVGNISLLTLCISVIICCFQRRRIFPKLTTIFFILHWIFLRVNGFVVSQITGEDIRPEAKEGWIYMGIIYLILTLYFFVSKRSKGTFVN